VTAQPLRLLVAAFALLAGCNSDDSTLTLVGSVERTLVELSAPASEVIVALPFERGQHVDVGAVVARLDPTLAQAEVARAEADVAGMEARVLASTRDLERIKGLRRNKIASEDQLEHAQLETDEATARRREASARLAAANKRLHDCTIVAPVAGVLDQLPFDVGERVPAGAVVAVLLQDGDPWVRIWIPARAVALLAPGTPVNIHIDGVMDTLGGHLLDIAREPEFTPHYALTERERVYLVYEARVLIESALTLRPGTPATVTISLQPPPAEVTP
jgi:HlyD family secretion protein